MRYRDDLTADQVRDVLDYDPKTGFFTWRKRISIRVTVGNLAGSLGRDGHLEIGLYGRHYLAHRVVWLWMTGAWPVSQIDHRDLNRANNKWSNLRLATHGQNVQNSGRRSNNTSGHKGVSFVRKLNKWHARIMANRELHLLGYFDTKDEAAIAYAEAAKRLHGDFARAA